MEWSGGPSKRLGEVKRASEWLDEVAEVGLVRETWSYEVINKEGHGKKAFQAQFVSLLISAAPHKRLVYNIKLFSSSWFLLSLLILFYLLWTLLVPVNPFRPFGPLFGPFSLFCHLWPFLAPFGPSSTPFDPCSAHVLSVSRAHLAPTRSAHVPPLFCPFQPACLPFSHFPIQPGQV